MKIFNYLVLLATLSASTAYANPNNTCEGQNLRKTFASGAAWNFCWTIRAQEGLVLSQVHYQAPYGTYRRVLGEAALAQIQGNFDDALVGSTFVSTQIGLGGNNSLSLKPQDCPSGTLQNFNGRPVLCTRNLQSGYLYKYEDRQRQSERYEISTNAKIGSRLYTLRWTFHENGTLEPAIGLSGTLPSVNTSNAAFGWPLNTQGTIASSFLDHYLWRLDFDLDSTASNDVVEEIISTPSADKLRKTRSFSIVQTEVGRRFEPEIKRFWRVRDGAIHGGNGIGYISYEIVPNAYDQSRANPFNEPWLSNDIWFTTFKNCERFAIDNSNTTNCASSVNQFTDNEPLNQVDVVVWYKQTQHFLPRGEDSNLIGTRWSSFQLVPRDWNAQNMF